MEKFNDNEYGWERNEDSLSSKWRLVNKNCTEFLPLYDDIKTNWRSGANDDDVYANALQSYYNAYTKHFTMKDAFFFLKDHPKWRVPKDPVGRVQEGYHVDCTGVGDSQGDPINLSQDFEAELFGEVPMPRPMGRDKAKKAQKTTHSSDAGGSSRGKSSSSSRVEDFMDKMEMVAAGKKECCDNFNEYVKLQTALTQVDLLGRSASTMEEPEDVERLRNLKRYVRSKMTDYTFPPTD